MRGVAGYGDDVGQVTVGQSAQFVVGFDELRAGDRGGADRLHRRHAAFDQRAELLGVLAMRDRRRVGAARNPYPGGNRLGQHRFRLREHLGGFLAELGRDAVDGHGLGQIGCGHQKGAMVDHHRNGVVGGEESVFDAVDAGFDAGADRPVADCVSGHPDAGAVGLVGDSGQFLVGVLLRSRRGAVRHHSA